MINDIQTLNSNVKDLNKDNFLFAHFILGKKEIPFNSEILLVNNVLDKSLDLIYNVENNNQTIKFPIQNVKNISYKTFTKIQNIPKKNESYELKSALLSAVVFGGNSMLQLLGNSIFNSLFDQIKNGYSKVSFNTYYEIIIEIEKKKYIINALTNPEEFIKQLNL